MASMYRGDRLLFHSDSVSRVPRKRRQGGTLPSRKGKKQNAKKSGKSRKPRNRKNWDATVNDLNAYKLDPKQLIEKKLMCVSKHRSNAKELIREQKRKHYHAQQMEKEKQRLDSEKKELIARKKDILTHQSYPQFCASNHLNSISDGDESEFSSDSNSDSNCNETDYDSDCETSDDCDIDNGAEQPLNGSDVSCDTEIGKHMSRNGSINSYDIANHNYGGSIQSHSQSQQSIDASLQNMQSLIGKLENRISTLETNDSIISELKKTNEEIRLNVLDSVNTQNTQILNLLQQLQSQQSQIFTLEKKVLDLEQKVSTTQQTTTMNAIPSKNETNANNINPIRVVNHNTQPKPNKSEQNPNFLILPPRAQKLSRRFLPINDKNPIRIPKPESQPNVIPQPYPKEVNIDRNHVVPTFRVATIGGHSNKQVRIENIGPFAANEQ